MPERRRGNPSSAPEDRARHEELKAKLRDRLRIDPKNFVRVSGEFRWDGKSLAPSEVEWVPTAADTPVTKALV